MSSDKAQTGAPNRGSLRLAERGAKGEDEQPRTALPRQFVNFTFYHARPEWRLLDEETKEAARREFVSVVDEFRPELLMHAY